MGSMTDVFQPFETLGANLLETWTAEDGFLYSLTIDSEGDLEHITSQIRNEAESVTSGSVYMDGNTLTNLATEDAMGSDIVFIMIIAIMLLLIILSVTSDSWLEPLVFLTVIGVGIIINLGTNIFKGEISFVTETAAAVLQLAISIDYGIVMLHAYRQKKSQGLAPDDAMLAAMKHAFPIVSSSAAVTFFGFLSLVLMVLTLGMDMGIVLAKGILVSFICVSFFMPCLILVCQKPLEKTKHRILIKDFSAFSKVCTRLAIPATLVVALVTVPAFLGEKQLDFIYGTSEDASTKTQLGRDQQTLDGYFSKENQRVVMVPSEQWSNELKMVNDLEGFPGVKSVTAYVSTVGISIPTDVLPETTLSQLIKDGYSRMIISASVPNEGEETFALVEKARFTAAEYYGEDFYVAGNSDVFYDLAQTSEQDITNVVLFSMLAIMFVLLIMYRSLSLPIILTVSIMIATWINLSIPYFIGMQQSYIGYLIISAVQLGATVDYAIIMASDYLENRQTMPKKESARNANFFCCYPDIDIRLNSDCFRFSFIWILKRTSYCRPWTFVRSRRYCVGCRGVLGSAECNALV